MGRPYQSEINALEQTYTEAIDADVTPIADFIASLAGRGLLAVGSGGSLVSASLMAQLHETAFRTVSRALTPLEFLEREGLWSRTGVALLSARGANKDILTAARSAQLSEPRALLGICNAVGSRLSQVLGPQHTFELHPSFGKDGFLATNSLLASCVAISKAYALASEAPPLSPSLREVLGDGLGGYQSSLTASIKHLLRPRTLHIIYAGPGRLAAMDLESRLSESALANSTISDIRNFGHGRHLWLAKRPDDSAVLFIHGPASTSLVKRTQRLLPKSIPTASIDLRFDDGRGVIQGLVGTILIVAAYGEAQSLDPGRPSVPDFGRAIFSVPMKTGKAADDDGDLVAVERKLDAAFATSEQFDYYKGREQAFREALEAALFRALVMDYDGTCITGRDRLKVPDKALKAALKPLLEAGIIVGFATGRGDSIFSSLREIVLDSHSKHVILALHNGTVIADLKGSVLASCNTGSEQSEGLTIFAAAFETAGLGMFASIRTHAGQHSIIPRSQAQGRWLVRAITELCEAKSLPLSVRSSGHSIDVVPRGLDKARILEYLKATHGILASAVLCIGDQGGTPGNDFLLLNAPHGLSVDRVSASTENCWNLSERGKAGPDATIAYLESLEPIGKGKFRFRPKGRHAR